MTDATATLAERIAAVRARIAAACERAGRDQRDVTLIAVSKTHAADAVAAAFAAGTADFGENRVQEAVAKIDELRARDVTPRWHLIGHLQTNKVKAAIGRFDILHTVDSMRLASAIEAAATAPVRVLIEVNIAGEASKFGVAADALPALAREMQALPLLDVIGLMTVAPRVESVEDARPVFRRLRELRDGLGLRELSMGMTDDFEVAVEEGSTLVRVGRAIFGDRAAGA